MKSKPSISILDFIFDTAKILMALGVTLFIFNCGGSGTQDSIASTDNEPADEDESINTEKLIGTPFEELTTGDEFPDYYFICDQYRTETIDAFPIKIFLAMFTAREESIIQEGIAIANDSIGFDAYEIQEVWSDDVRLIYKVDYIEDAAASTFWLTKYFNEKIAAEHVNTDWAIAIRGEYVDEWIIAHELGHANGINGHYKIDYENNTYTALEENSLMSSNVINISDYVLSDYNFMMSMQSSIMTEHLGEEGTLVGGDCEFLKENYDTE